MNTVAKCFTFDAAHRLDRLPPDHKCHRMHGHTYEVEIIFMGRMDNLGFVIDYADIARLWQPLHDQLDHRVLNDVRGLENPTTEHLAWWIFANLDIAIASSEHRWLSRVKVKESSTTWCEVSVMDRHDMDLTRYLKETVV